MTKKAVLVANPKGGSGKTTLPTNLAGALANAGEQVVLWDVDRQRSSLHWLSLRPADRPPIEWLGSGAGGSATRRNRSKWLILDSAAGLYGKSLTYALRLAHQVLIPVQPSVFDLAAISVFLNALAEERAVRDNIAYIGIVGMRVDSRTRASATLEAFLAQFRLPVVSYLRDTQVYVNAAFNGLSIFDLPDNMSSRDVEQWQPLLEWITDF